MKPIDDAKRFAIAAHGNQLYGNSSLPYMVHLADVEGVLLRFGIEDEAFRRVAWLHDVLEDTDTTESVLANDFGNAVAQAVAALSNPKEGKNRHERHKISYPRIAANPLAHVVKVADRIANVESGGKLDMYKKEHAFFRSELRREDAKLDKLLEDAGFGPKTQTGPLDQMWAHLDSLIEHHLVDG